MDIEELRRMSREGQVVNKRITLAGIEWRILDAQGSDLLLISEKILEKRPYNIEKKDITWENCTLREYLNGEFFNKLGEIKHLIAETRINNPDNQWYGTAGGNATPDKVFLLTLDELVKYFGDSGDLLNKRRKDVDGNLKSDGYLLYDQYNNARRANYGSEAWWWWLRSPGSASRKAARVSNGCYVGSYVYVDGDGVDNDDGGVRPALWLDLNAEAVNFEQSDLLCGNKIEAEKADRQTAPQAAAPGTDPLMIRAWQCAEDGDWKDAADYFNKVLDADPLYAPGFLGLICVDLKASKEDKLANIDDPASITNHKHYKRAIANADIKTRLDGYLQTINARIEAKRKAAEEAARKKRVQDTFDNAAQIMNDAQSPDDYRKAITAFGSIDSNYQDINSQIKGKIAECEKKMQQCEKKMQQMADELDKVLAPLREKFDPKAKAEKQAKLQEQRKSDKERLDAENAKTKADIDAKCLQIQQKFDTDHKAWQDEYNRLKTAYDTEYTRWETGANAVKAQAEQWKSQGLCPHDGGTLKGLLTKKCTECGKAPGEPIKTSTAPTQPNYPAEPKRPQMPSYTPKVLDESKYTLKEDNASIINKRVTLAGIEWRILDAQGSDLLLISEKILEKRPYDVEKDVMWENCTLRKYLNGEFFNKLGAIKPAIAETRINNPDNQWYGTAGGNATNDKVFLLSLNEVCRYFGDSTANLQKKGSTGSDYSIDDKNNFARIANYGSEASGWWLRSPGNYSSRAARVDSDGNVGVDGSFVDSGADNLFRFGSGSSVNRYYSGVRPALWLDLNVEAVNSEQSDSLYGYW